MTSFARRITPYFAASVLCTAGCAQAERRPFSTPPDLSAAALLPLRTEESARFAPDAPLDWRDAFKVTGETPEDAATLPPLLDRIFALPSVKAALKKRVETDRAQADYIESHDDTGLAFAFAEDTVQGLREKIDIFVSGKPDAETCVRGAVVKFQMNGKETQALPSPAVVLKTVPDVLHLRVDGTFQDESLLESTTHELVHVLWREDNKLTPEGKQSEQETVRKTNTLMQALDPDFVPRGNYLMTRYPSGSAACATFWKETLREATEVFVKGFARLHPADPLPVLRDAADQPLAGTALAESMARDRFILCP